MTKGDDGKSGHFCAAYGLQTNEQTRKHYQSWADTYDKEVAQDNGYAQPDRVAAMLAGLQADRNSCILDAGCGSGLSGLALGRAGYNTIDGCDFSPEMLEKCTQKVCYRNLFKANLNDGLPETADNTYDVVTCVGIFSFGHVFPDACDHLLRVLRPAGHLIIAVNEHYWDEGGLADKISLLEKTGTAEVLAREFGEHLPGHGVKGWVIALRKVAQAS